MISFLQVRPHILFLPLLIFLPNQNIENAINRFMIRQVNINIVISNCGYPIVLGALVEDTVVPARSLFCVVGLSGDGEFVGWQEVDLGLVVGI